MLSNFYILLHAILPHPPLSSFVFFFLSSYSVHLIQSYRLPSSWLTSHSTRLLLFSSSLPFNHYFSATHPSLLLLLHPFTCEPHSLPPSHFSSLRSSHLILFFPVSFPLSYTIHLISFHFFFSHLAPLPYFSLFALSLLPTHSISSSSYIFSPLLAPFLLPTHSISFPYIFLLFSHSPLILLPFSPSYYPSLRYPPLWQYHQQTSPNTAS